jgi:hypothetical protein
MSRIHAHLAREEATICHHRAWIGMASSSSGISADTLATQPRVTPEKHGLIIPSTQAMDTWKKVWETVSSHTGCAAHECVSSVLPSQSHWR